MEQENNNNSWVRVGIFLLLIALGLFLVLTAIGSTAGGAIKDGAYWARRARAAKKKKAQARAQTEFEKLNATN